MYADAQKAAGDGPAFGSDAWVRAAVTDDGEGLSGGEIRNIIRAAFAIVLARRWEEPPLYLGSDEQPDAWGWVADAPTGPALLPPLMGLLADSEEEAPANCVLGVPPKPTAGNSGEGVCLRCVASKEIASGQTLWAAGRDL